MRRMLTSEIEAFSEKLLGYKITQKELRLMPYLLDCMMNQHSINPRKIENQERAILSE